MFSQSLRFAVLLFSWALLVLSATGAELDVPASTAYLEPDYNGAKVGKEGISGWTNPVITISWFGEIKTPGKLTASVTLRLAKDRQMTLRLTAAGQNRDATVRGTGEAQAVSFGEFAIAKPGYVRIALQSVPPVNQNPVEVKTLLLGGPATEGAHFNMDARRNAASVHLMYPTPKDAAIELFYNEVVAVEDPVATYYMACGFARGYFGMQVNSPTERRIIFSVWDSGSGQTAKDRAAVSAENRVQLLAKGDGVVASDFGNEGTGGHSHLVYPWKTGQAQRFTVTAKAEGDHTDYSGWWFNPEKGKWMLIASFRAPHDGKWLRGLYSFCENFAGANGELRRKALFGPQWIRTADGAWKELREASFSHDPTGKENRLDRFMGVEGGRFFLSTGGFLRDSTHYGEKFTRPAAGQPPALPLAEMSMN